MPKRLTIQDCIEIASNKGGHCLSRDYINSSTKIQWMCKKGHIWDAKTSDIKAGYWCPHCAGVAKPTINELQAIAEAHGGKCLSTEYKNNSAYI